jgi:hypothetical protein
VTIDAAYVQERIGALAANADLSRFILYLLPEGMNRTRPSTSSG